MSPASRDTRGGLPAARGGTPHDDRSTAEPRGTPGTHEGVAHRLLGWLAVAIAIAVFARFAGSQLGALDDWMDRMDRMDRIDRADRDRDEGGDPSAPQRLEPQPPPYLEPARVLLGRIETGDPISTTLDWHIDHIEGPNEDGEIRVVVIHDGQRVSIWVRPRGTNKRPPPVRTESYDLYYDRPSPPEPRLDDEVLPALTEAIAARVRAHEGAPPDSTTPSL